MAAWTVGLIVTLIVLVIIAAVSVAMGWARILVHLLWAAAVLLRAGTIIWAHVIYLGFVLASDSCATRMTWVFW